METTPVSIAVCNQKGGVGKSTFTVLLASYLHYFAGYDVLVVDCDYPQWQKTECRTVPKVRLTVPLSDTES